jgi:murein DD-endopeptidase MepM/ murein hydrolase activator NlpD
VPTATRPPPRLVLVVLAGVMLATGALAAPSPAAATTTPVPAVAAPEHDVHHLPPVPGEVWRPFEPPGTAYGPGHRGVDLGAEPGETVRASAAGVVVHAGAIAGTTWVSIDHAEGLRTAYGPLTALRVTAGQRVAASETIGALAPGGHGHAGRDRGLHFSVRRDGIYLDPLGLLSGGGLPSLHGPGRTAPLSETPGVEADLEPTPGQGVAAPEERGRPRPAPRERLAVPGPPKPAASTR